MQANRIKNKSLFKTAQITMFLWQQIYEKAPSISREEELSARKSSKCDICLFRGALVSDVRRRPSVVVMLGLMGFIFISTMKGAEGIQSRPNRILDP